MSETEKVNTSVSEKTDVKVTASGVNSASVLSAIFNSDKVPKWALGVGTIILVLTLLFNGLHLGTIIQNKLENDNALHLQIITQRYQADLQAMNTLTNLNQELNNRLQNVLTAYNEQAVINGQLSTDNLKLNREVDIMKVQLTSKDMAIMALEKSNKELSDQVATLIAQNAELQKQIDTLNRRMDLLFPQEQGGNIP